MRNIIVVLSVFAVFAVVMTAFAPSAFAQDGGGGDYMPPPAQDQYTMATPQVASPPIVVAQDGGGGDYAPAPPPTKPSAPADPTTVERTSIALA